MINAIILAAGKGTRMKSKTSKVMHRILGVSMFEIVLNLAKSVAVKDLCIIASEENEVEISKITGSKIVIQKDRLGTGHAVSLGLPFLNLKNDRTFIFYGDTPLLTSETVARMMKVEADVVVLGFFGAVGEKYGRLKVNGDDLEEIIEFKDLSKGEEQINLYNSGIFLVKTSVLKTLIPKISNKNQSGEYYLTDVVSLARASNMQCKFILCDEEEVLGVNNREELSRAEMIMQNRLRKQHMLSGVTLIDPRSVFFSLDTKIAEDVVIEPNVFFGKGVEIETATNIKAFSYLEGCVVKGGVSIGPFARIRGETIIGANSKIGNFVEVKNSVLEEGVKAGHLAYIGDAEIGKSVNVGAGAVFCNYDGSKKHKTTIEDGVFIGSNTSLVAPLSVGAGAVLAAGSVITQNVEADSLAISRSKQAKILNYKKK